MPAPQQVGAAFYLPPPGQPINAFAAATQAFFAEFNPWGREVLRARLAASSPAAKYSLIAQLEQERARLLAERESTMRAMDRASADRSISQEDLVREGLKYLASVNADATRASIANAEQSTELVKAGRLEGEGKKLAERARRAIAASEYTLGEAMRAGDVDKADRAITALEQELAGIAQDANNLEAQPRQALSGVVQDELGKLKSGDPTVRGVITSRADVLFRSPDEVAVTRAGSRAPTLAEAMQQIEASLGGGGGGGSASAGATRSTSTSSPTLGGGGAATSPAAGAPSPSGGANDPTLAGVRHIDQLLQQLQAEDPLERLGGFYEALPTRDGMPRAAARTRTPRTPEIGQPLDTMVGRIGTAPPPEFGYQENDQPVPAGARARTPPASESTTTTGRPKPKAGDKVGQIVDELLQSEQGPPPGPPTLANPNLRLPQPTERPTTPNPNLRLPDAGVMTGPRPEDGGPAVREPSALSKVAEGFRRAELTPEQRARLPKLPLPDTSAAEQRLGEVVAREVGGGLTTSRQVFEGELETAKALEQALGLGEKAGKVAEGVGAAGRNALEAFTPEELEAAVAELRRRKREEEAYGDQQ